MDIEEALRLVQAEYCPELFASHVEQTARDIFKIGLVLKPGASLCDVGGGLGAFGPACAVLGMDVTVVDDFRDEVNLRVGEAGFLAHKKHGVRVIYADASKGLPVTETFDVMTCFASIEHHHNSPKRMLHSMVDHLAPGGLFVLSVPNALDIMRRVQTPLGRGGWSALSEWYEEPQFRGHVREFVLSDLDYIAKDLGLADWRVVGHSSIWHRGSAMTKVLSAVARIVDRWPSLSTEQFLVGHKR